MKNTFKLYRAHPEVWKDLPYSEAVLVKESLASRAMDYYRLEKNIPDYKDSEKARDFNRAMTIELEE